MIEEENRNKGAVRQTENNQQSLGQTYISNKITVLTPSFSGITLNVNGLSFLIRRFTTEWIKKHKKIKIQLYAVMRNSLWI